jgi:nucleotide-binding universal stress UspA family protein
MRRILVPLDGGPLAETILSDACDLAGRDGELILLHVIRTLTMDHGTDGFSHKTAAGDSEDYLATRAKPLRQQGFTVHTRTVVRADVSAAIDGAAVEDDVDLIVCATHGRGPGGRLIHGSVAWEAVANSTVPVFLKHVEEGTNAAAEPPKHFRIMVPLDGSAYAEKALPLADWFALKWNAPLSLVRVVDYAGGPAGFGFLGTIDYTEETAAAKRYLDGISAGLQSESDTHAWAGRTVPDLVDFTKEHSITHVVMASHGHTAMWRVILGSVADGLIHELHCPIIVVPALARGRIEDHAAESIQKDQRAGAGGGLGAGP